MARYIRPAIPLAELTRDETLYLQNLLIRYGYNPGPVDGVMGPQTMAAYQAFAEANKTTPNETYVGNTSSLISLLSDTEMGPELEGQVHRGTGKLTGSVPQPAAAPAPIAPTATVAETPPANSAVAPPGPIPEVEATDAEATKEIYRKYPMLAPYLDHPEIGPLLRWAQRDGMSDAELEAKLHTTWWWKLTDSKVRQWDRLAADDPAEVQRLMKVKGQDIYQKAVQSGVPMSESDAEYLAGRVLREGWSDAQTNRFFGAMIRNVGYNAGTITETQAKLRKLATQYMVPTRPEDVTEWATRILEGTATTDTFLTSMRTDAMNRFHWLKDQIDGGATPQDLFKGVKNTVAQTLEVDPEQIDFTDPKWADLVNPIGSGKDARSMTYYEAQRWARGRSEWKFTKNANDQTSATTNSLLKAMGVIK